MSKSAEYLIIGLLWLILASVADSSFVSVASSVLAIICFILSTIFSLENKSYDHR